MLIPSSAPKNAIPVAKPPVNAACPNSDGVTRVKRAGAVAAALDQGQQREEGDAGGDHQGATRAASRARGPG